MTTRMIGRFSLLIFASAMSWWGTGCSPDMFSSDDRDHKVREVPSYRKVQQTCSGLEMAGAQMGAKEFRGLLACLNGGGNLKELVQMLDKLSDAELAPLVDILNVNLLSNPSTLFDLEKTIAHLEEASALDPFFEQAARLLDKPAMTSSLMQVLEAGYRNDADGFHWLMGRLGQWIQSGKNIEQAMDVGIVLTQTPAYSDLQSRLKCPAGPGRCAEDLDRILRSALNYVGANGEAGEKLLTQFAYDQNFGSMLTETMGRTQEEVRQKAWNLTSLMGFLGNQKTPSGDSLFYAMSRLFFELHGKDLACMRQSVRIQDADMLVLRELMDYNASQPADFLGRFMPLTLLTLSGFCDLGEKTVGYPAMVSLAQQPDHLKTLFDLLVKTDGYADDQGKNSYLLKILIDILAQPGLADLAPAVEAVSQRGAWSGALLMAALPTADGEVELKNQLRFFLEQENGRSVIRQLNKILTVASGPIDTNSGKAEGWKRWLKWIGLSPGGGFPPLYKLAWEAADWTNEPPILAPVLSSVRGAYYINDVHPLHGVALGLLKNSRVHDGAFQTLFKMASLPEFPEAMKMLARQSRNGELKTLVKNMTELFHKFAQQGARDLPKRPAAPAIQVGLRHQLSPQDLENQQAEQLLARATSRPEEGPSCGACEDLDFSLSMDQFWLADRYSAQLNRFSSCMSPESQLASNAGSIEIRKKMASAMNWLRSQPLNGVSSWLPGVGDTKANLLSHFDLMVDTMRLFGAPSVVSAGGGTERDRAALGFLTTVLKEKTTPAPAGEKNEISRLLTATRFWIEHRIMGAALDLLGPLYRQKKQQLQNLMNFAASELSGSLSRGDSFPALSLYLNEARKGMDRGVSIPSQESLSRFNYTRSVRDDASEIEITSWLLDTYKLECIQETGIPGQGRNNIHLAAKIREYDESYTAWERERYSWGFNELKAKTDELVKIFTRSEKAHAGDGGSAAAHLLGVIRDYSAGVAGGVGKYSVQYFADWFHDRSVDSYKIFYFYPGERKARLRIVSSMDMMEMVLLNADFKVEARNAFAQSVLNLLADRNFGIKFIQDIGMSWGDEPQDQWPEEVKRYYLGRHSPTLKETFDDIIGTIEKFELLLYPDIKGSSNPYDGLTKCKQIGNERGRTMSGSLGSFLSRLAMTEEEIADVQRRFFNLNQILKVLAWNLPKNNWCSHQDAAKYDCAGKEYLADGLKVLRQFFFHAYAANEIRGGIGPFDPRYKVSDEQNTLNTMTKLVRMGGLHQVSRQVSLFSERKSLGHKDENFRPTQSYYDFVNTLVQAVSLKNSKGKYYVDEIMHKLLSEAETAGPEGLDGSFLWQLISRVYARLEEDNSLKVRHELKSALVYGLQVAGVGPSGLNIGPEVLNVAADVIDQNLDLLKNRPDRLDWFLHSPKLVGALEALYQSPRTRTPWVFYEQVQNPVELEKLKNNYGYECDANKLTCWKDATKVRNQVGQMVKRAADAQIHRDALELVKVLQIQPALPVWNELLTQWEALDQARDANGERYAGLKMSEILGSAMIFMGTGPEAQGSPAWDASARVREQLKLLMSDSGYADLWLHLAAYAPQDMNRELVEMLYTAIQTHQAEEFIGFLNRALQKTVVDAR